MLIPSVEYLIWSEGGQGYGLPVTSVQRVARTVALSPAPTGCSNFLGLLEAQGAVIPVLSLEATLHGVRGIRPRFRDQLVLAQGGQQSAAFLAEQIFGVEPCVSEGVNAPEGLASPETGVAALVRTSGGRLVCVPDIDSLVRGRIGTRTSSNTEDR